MSRASAGGPDGSTGPGTTTASPRRPGAAALMRTVAFRKSLKRTAAAPLLQQRLEHAVHPGRAFDDHVGCVGDLRRPLVRGHPDPDGRLQGAHLHELVEPAE